MRRRLLSNTHGDETRHDPLTEHIADLNKRLWCIRPEFSEPFDRFLCLYKGTGSVDGKIRGQLVHGCREDPRLEPLAGHKQCRRLQMGYLK